MKKSNSISCSKNIFLDKSRMDELYTILLKHCEKFQFQTKCVDNSSIEFGKGRTKKLEITGYAGVSGWDRKLNLIISTEHPKGPSVDCTYYFTQLDEEAVFKKEIVDFWNKAAKKYVQPRIGEGIAFLLFFIATFHFSGMILPDNWLLKYICAYISTQILLALFNHFIWYKLFPMVSFSWGESIRYYKNIDNWNDKVFWCIIVAILVAIIANHLSDLLKGG